MSDHAERPPEAGRAPADLYDPTIPDGGTPPPPPPRGDWREEIVSLSGLNVLAGIWLIIAPWVLGYSTRDPRWNDIILGIIVFLLAVGSAEATARAFIRRQGPLPPM